MTGLMVSETDAAPGFERALSGDPTAISEAMKTASVAADATVKPRMKLPPDDRRSRHTRGHTAMTAITTSARHLGTNPPGRKDRGAGRESGRGGPGGGSDRRGLRAAGLDRSPARVSSGRRDDLGGPALRTAD